MRIMTRSSRQNKISSLATGIKLLQLHQRCLHFSDKTRINNPNMHFILEIDLRDNEQTTEKVNC